MLEGQGWQACRSRGRCLTVYKTMLFALLCWEAGRHGTDAADGDARGGAGATPATSPAVPPWLRSGTGSTCSVSSSHKGASLADACPDAGSAVGAAAAGAADAGGAVGLFTALVSEVGRQVGVLAPSRLPCPSVGLLCCDCQGGIP